MRSSYRWMAVGAAACGLVLAGCGGNTTSGSASGDDLTGTVALDGSSTVFPISEAIAEEFQKEHPNVRVTVGLSGTGGGFKKVSGKEIDIADASRPIKESEVEAIRAAGVELIEIPVAYDGLSVVVNPQNDWVDCLTVAELRAIWEPNSKISNWSQVRPGFPDVPMKLYGPGTDSGTFDYFTDAVAGKEGASRSDYTASEDDNTLVQGVAGDRGGLGYFGYAYYEENQNKLKLLQVDGGEGCVAPSPETINNGSYQPLSRPVFIYVRRDAADRPEVQAFVQYYLKNAPEIVRSVGYIPLPQEAYDLATRRFENRTTGSMFEGGSQVGVKIEDLLNKEAAE